MGKFIDEMGNRYGKLVVALEAGRTKRGIALWKCHCDCGRTTIVDGSSLRSGNTKSCGCLKPKNEIGNRYGRLTIIEEAGQNEKKSLLWKCRCDCGNISIYVGDNLRSGNVRSCGCLRRIDEKIGAKYGKLTVIVRAGKNKWGQVWWECRCECGNITKVVGSNLRNGHTKSCGCSRSGLPEGEAAFNSMINSIKYSAKKRGYSFNLTNEQLRKITKKNCHYCGSPPTNAQKTYYANGNYTYSGVDRVDNKKGYTIDNVVPCCRICNRAKDTMPTIEFLKWIERVSTHQRRLNK